jgi:hypothetical protein
MRLTPLQNFASLQKIRWFGGVKNCSDRKADRETTTCKDAQNNEIFNIA